MAAFTLGSRVKVECYDSDEARRTGAVPTVKHYIIQSLAKGGAWGMEEGTSSGTARFLLIHKVSKRGTAPVYWAVDVKLF